MDANGEEEAEALQRTQDEILSSGEVTHKDCKNFTREVKHFEDVVSRSVIWCNPKAKAALCLFAGTLLGAVLIAGVASGCW